MYINKQHFLFQGCSQTKNRASKTIYQGKNQCLLHFIVSITKFSIGIGYLLCNQRATTWMPDFRCIQPHIYDKIAKGRSPVESWKKLLIVLWLKINLKTQQFYCLHSSNGYVRICKTDKKRILYCQDWDWTITSWSYVSEMVRYFEKHITNAS